MSFVYRVFIDMDGVVADFVGGACKLHGLDNVYYEPDFEYHKDAYDVNSFSNGMDPKEFWGAMGYDFWANLDKTSEADELIEFLKKRFGVHNLCFLTSPILTKGCADGKREWVKKHYPDIPVLISCRAAGGEPPKWMAAGPVSVLIDDSDTNIDLWCEHGGVGHVWPRPWNKAYKNESVALHRLAFKFNNVKCPFCYI